jgi:hypothetical protein
LVLAVLAIVFVLQNRAVVSGWIAGPSEAPVDAHAASWRRLRRRLAETWHVLGVSEGLDIGTDWGPPPLLLFAT